MAGSRLPGPPRRAREGTLDDGCRPSHHFREGSVELLLLLGVEHAVVVVSELAQHPEAEMSRVSGSTRPAGRHASVSGDGGVLVGARSHLAAHRARPWLRVPGPAHPALRGGVRPLVWRLARPRSGPCGRSGTRRPGRRANGSTHPNTGRGSSITTCWRWLYSLWRRKTRRRGSPGSGSLPPPAHLRRGWPFATDSATRVIATGAVSFHTAVMDDHRGTTAGQQLRIGRAQTAAGAGDEDDLVGEADHVGPPVRTSRSDG